MVYVNFKRNFKINSKLGKIRLVIWKLIIWYHHLNTFALKGFKQSPFFKNKISTVSIRFCFKIDNFVSK